MGEQTGTEDLVRSGGRAPGVSPSSEWGGAFTLTVAILVLRVAYLVWLCPYELAADEAQYWDWSRRPALSYYSKGPGIAWTIGASTAVFGDDEWAVRLPAALAAALTMLALAGLATDVSGGDARAGLVAAALFTLVPAYQATALLMTIDGPLFACWALAAWAAHRAFAAMRSGGAAPLAWLGLGAALGVGFLYKYTILLLLPGLICYAIADRRRLLGFVRNAPWAALAGVLFLATISPVLVWNHQHGYPTVAHLLDHLQTPGGDVARDTPWSYNPKWTFELIGSQVGIVGPFLCALFVLAVARVVRRRPEATEPRSGAALMLWCAAPVLLFYLAVSFVADCEGNWPLAGYLTLLVPAAGVLSSWASKAAPADGRARARRLIWHGVVLYGLSTGVGMLMLNVLDRAPVLGKAIPLHRISGHRSWADEVSELVEATRQRTGAQPMIVADRYGKAALLAYYMPGRPVVSDAASAAGGARSAYDFFADADLRSGTRLGQPAVMVGGSAAFWQRALRFRAFEQVRPGRFVGLDYLGPAREVEGRAP